MNKVLSQTIEDRQEWLEKVITLGKTVAGITDLHICLLTIYKSIREGLGFDRVGIFLYDSEQKLAQGTYGTDRTGNLQDERGMVLPVMEDQSFLDVINHPKSFVYNSNYDTKYGKAATRKMEGVGDHAVVGAWAGNMPVAILAVDNLISKRAFTKEQLEALRLFAGYAGLAIHNAQLYEMIQEENAERRQAEAELKAAFDRLKVLDHLKDEFIANVSHELRTPITILKIKSYLLKNCPEHFEESLEDIQQATQRLEALIEDTLYALRIEYELYQVPLGKVELNSLVEQVVTKYSSIANAQGIELSWKQNGRLRTINGHTIMLKRALGNLLSNAVNYSSKGDQVLISTGLESKGDQQWITLRVSDNGPGIPKDELPYIFDRFYRGKAALEHNKPGTGLGLYIAREIVNYHTGQLEVESDGPGNGVTFTIWLPVSET